MAIRFICKRCNQMLGIASRKANTEITCPKCGLAQIVPNEEAAAAALAMTRSTRAKDLVEDASGVVVYDDEPEAIDTPRPSTERSAASTAASADRAAAAPDPADAPQPVPTGMILYHRQTLYVQAVLFVVVGIVAFGAGYFMGRGDAKFDAVVRREQANKQPVFVEGKLYYRPTVDKISGDEDAVVIALPELPDEKGLDKKIRVHGIRPQDPAPRASEPSLLAIEKLGGAYARADENGSFSMEVPQQGAYRMLLISRHTLRPKGAVIEELESDEIGNYFTSTSDLIGTHKYRWLREDLVPGHKPIEQDFGLDGTK